MKIISHFFMLALCLGSFLPTVQGQEYKVSMSSGKLLFDGVSKVTIEAHSGNEVIILHEDADYKLPERAKGLRAISASGKVDNTNIGLHAHKEGDKLSISSISKKSKRYLVKVPPGVSIEYKHSSNNGGKINFHSLPNEIEVSANYNSIYLENVSGPVAVSTVYGKIEAIYDRLPKDQPSKLYSVYQLIDISLPATAKANVKLQSTYGEMYTDFDLKQESSEGDLHKLSSSKITGTINGGGTFLDLSSTYQNIYLRKKK